LLLETQLTGFGEFREGQRKAVEHVLAGESALVVLPTGTGKSLCFQVWHCQ
jgi:superfamily II DNA helicase RecQ